MFFSSETLFALRYIFAKRCYEENTSKILDEFHVQLEVAEKPPFLNKMCAMLSWRYVTVGVHFCKFH